MSIQKNILIKDKNIFIVRLLLEAGDVIPLHSSHAYVTASVTHGQGIFTVEDKKYELTPGVFISMQPLEKHSIEAHSHLEIIVHHIMIQPNKLNDNRTETGKICGAEI